MNDINENISIATNIGTSFCSQYYGLFDSDRKQLASFYTDHSIMSFEGDVKLGSTAIGEKLVSLPFTTVKHVATSIDCHPTVDRCILITVLGQVKTDDDPPKSFLQSFLLKGSDNSYFVMNDIFRLGLHNF